MFLAIARIVPDIRTLISDFNLDSPVSLHYHPKAQRSNPNFRFVGTDLATRANPFFSRLGFALLSSSGYDSPMLSDTRLAKRKGKRMSKRQMQAAAAAAGAVGAWVYVILPIVEFLSRWSA